MWESSLPEYCSELADSLIDCSGSVCLAGLPDFGGLLLRVVCRSISFLVALRVRGGMGRTDCPGEFRGSLIVGSTFVFWLELVEIAQEPSDQSIKIK